MKFFLALTLALPLSALPARAQEAPPSWSWTLSIPVPGLGQIQMGEPLRGVLFLGGVTLPFVGGMLIKDQFNQPGAPIGTAVGGALFATAGAVYLWNVWDALRLQQALAGANVEDDVGADTPALPEQP